MRILIVEDEEKMAKALRTGLEADQFSVSIAHTGEDGFFRASTEPYDLVILDLMLPGRDGMEVLSALRQKNMSVPVLDPHIERCHEGSRDAAWTLVPTITW